MDRSPPGGVRLLALDEEIASCRQCPRLVTWREQVAEEKRAAFRDQTYWGRPVPGFGDPGGRLIVVGLAPAAHGANRTGRVFTGDRSGDWLFRAMYRAGFANQPTSVSADDGLVLSNARVLAVVRCAPPDNKPTREELATCTPFLLRELDLLPKPSVLVALGAFAFSALCSARSVSPRPRFAHGLRVDLGDGDVLLCSFHPSQQNTFTGRLTEPMLDNVFSHARSLVDGIGARQFQPSSHPEK